jgi:hypothetical protein
MYIWLNENNVRVYSTVRSYVRSTWKRTCVLIILQACLCVRVMIRVCACSNWEHCEDIGMVNLQFQ